MSEIRSVSVRLSAKTSEYIAGMGAAKRSTDSLEGSLARVEARGAAASKGLSGLKHAAVLGTAGVVAGFVVAEKAAADFGEKMALVQTLSHANAQQMKALSNEALNAGQRIGYTAGQVADGEAEMIKAGVSLQDILRGGLKGALDLAAAGQTDVATATQIAASAMTQFKLQGKDIPHLADLLAAGADKALGSVEDLGYGLSQAGTTAHQMGLDVNQTVGTLAAFAQAGLIGERGGTTFKQMLLQLASPTKNAQGYMDKYGLSLYKANGQIKTMPELADNLRRSFEHLTPAQRNAALGTIFGSRAIQGANILMAEGGKGIAEWIRKVNDQGFAAQQASGKLNSLKGDLAKFKSEVQSDLINLGTGSQSPLRGLVQGATRELHKLRVNGDLKRWGNEISDVFTTIGRDALPIAREVGHALGTIGSDLGHIAQGFQKLPDGLQQAIVTGGVVAYGAHKLGIDSLVKGVYGTGSRRGAAGAVGALATRGGVVPVYVTNWGGKSIPGGAGGEGPRGVPVPRGGVPKTPTNLGIPEHFWDLTTTGARDLLSGSLGKVSGEGLLKGALRGVLGAPAWITAGDAGHEVIQGKSLGPNAFSNMIAAAGAKKAADATKAWAKAQSGLNELLLAPALPKYAARLSSLPKKVQTEIATPGAVTSLSDVAELAKRYHLTPKQVRTVIELANSGKVKAEAAAIGRLYGLTPKQVRTLISQAGMDSSQAAIRRLASLYHLTPKQVRTIVHADTAQAQAAVEQIRAMLGGIPRSISTSYYVNQVNRVYKGPVTGPGSNTSADGSTVPKTGLPYADRHLYMLADGEEVTSNRRGQADRYRPVLKAINADMPRHQIRDMLAGGGTAGGWPIAWGSTSWKTPSLPWYQQFLLMAQGFGHGGRHAQLPDRLAAEIRHLNAEIKANTRELKNKPTKAERARVEANQKELRKQLAHLTAQRSAIRSFSLSSVLPTHDPANPIFAGTRAQVKAFEHDFTKAGGAWTKSIEKHAAKLEKDALALDRSNRAITAETNKRDSLKQTLADTRAARSDLVSSVSDMFTSTDLFASQALPPGAQWLSAADRKQFAADPLSRLRGDIASEQQFTSLATTLGKSLHGNALQYAEQQGVGALQTLAAMSPTDLHTFQTLFDQRANGAVAAGKLAGDQRYGAEIAAQTKQLSHANTHLAALVKGNAHLIKRIEHMEATLKAAAENSAHIVGAEIRGEVKKGATKAKGARR